MLSALFLLTALVATDPYESIDGWVQCDTPQHKQQFVNGVHIIVRVGDEMHTLNTPQPEILNWANGRINEGLKVLQCHLTGPSKQ